MEYEIIFLLTGIILLLIDIIFLSTKKLRTKQKSKYGFFIAISAFGTIIISYATLLNAFIANDFSISGVYCYSSTTTSLLSKVYGSWAGPGGSMLCITTLLSIGYIALRISTLRKPNKFNISTSQVFTFVLLVFLIVCLIRNPFEHFSDIPVEGRGLNPQLQSVWMAIHPPIVFSAYVFVVLAYALTLASIKTGTELDTSRLFTFSTYIAWLLLTLGIALGGVWSYEVLGWGGYWAWDPVETASLLPWLFLTAYFIVKSIVKKSSLTREFMIMITFASLVFLSAITRGGFTQSVHSYAISAVGPIMLSFAVTIIAYFFYLRKNKKQALIKIDLNKFSLTASSIFIGFWALIFMAVVCLFGIALPDFTYNHWIFPFVLIFVVSLLGFSFDEKTHYSRLILITLTALGVGIIISVMGILKANPLTTLIVPLLILTLIALLHKVVKSIQRKALEPVGHGLLYLGVIVLLLGVFISAGTKDTIAINGMKANIPVEAMQLEIELSDFSIKSSSTKVYNEQVENSIPEYSILKSNVMIQQSGRSYDGTLIARFYPNYGLELKPLIIATMTGDFYLHFEYSESLYNALFETYIGNRAVPQEVEIILQTVPLVHLVWSGVILITFGISAKFIADLKHKGNSVETDNKYINNCS